MRKKYCDEESVFEHIWKHADRDGIWIGNAGGLAEKFGVAEDEAHSVLGDLADRGLIEILVPGTYGIVNFRERDDVEEEDEQEAHR